MTGLVRKATILCIGGLLIAGAAMAGIPSAANSTIPTCITLADVPSFASCNAMVIRDANNNPVAGSSVTVDFSTCVVGDVKICDSQHDQATVLAGAGTQPATAVCGSKTVTMSADALGQLCILLNGGTNLAFGHAPAAGNRPVCASIYADSKLMGTVVVTVASFDLNASASVTSGDLSQWLLNYFGPAGGGTYRSKGDYNCTGSITSGDLSQWLLGFGAAAGGAPVGCVTFCP